MFVVGKGRTTRCRSGGAPSWCHRPCPPATPSAGSDASWWADYGYPTDVPWAVAFPQGLPPTTADSLARFGWTMPEGMDPTTVLSVHPTQLYEVALMTAAFMLIWKLADKAWGTGWLFGLYLALAGAERLFVELFRAKDDRFFAGFTLALVTSVAILLLGMAVIAWRRGEPAMQAGAYLGGRKRERAG